MSELKSTDVQTVVTKNKTSRTNALALFVVACGTTLFVPHCWTKQNKRIMCSTACLQHHLAEGTIHPCIHIYIYIDICIHIYTYTYLHMFIYTYTYLHMFIYINVHREIVYIHIYTYIYMYTHTLSMYTCKGNHVL